MITKKKNKPVQGEGLILVDVQNDFLPGGSLAVPEGDQIIPILNEYLQLFVDRKLPVFATRDWHPENHCSFVDQGGMWPPHCIAGSYGAAFPDTLHISEEIIVISKAQDPKADAYSGLDHTDLDIRMKSLGIECAWVGGLATDYCVINTVQDLISSGYVVYLLSDAIRAVNVHSEDGQNAISEMVASGAHLLNRDDII